MNKYEQKLKEIKEVLGLAEEPSKEATEAAPAAENTVAEKTVTMSEFVEFKQEVAAKMEKMVSSVAEMLEQMAKEPESVPVAASEEVEEETTGEDVQAEASMTAEEIANAPVIDMTGEQPVEMSEETAAPLAHSPEKEVKSKVAMPNAGKPVNKTLARVQEMMFNN